MSWSKGQARTFAKDLMRTSLERAARQYLTGSMRTALVQAYVFAVVRGQAAETVRVADMDQLLADVVEAIEEKLPRFFE